MATKEELKDYVFSALKCLNDSLQLQFAFLKLGSKCNANEIRPFTEAECDMEVIKDADGYYLSVGFTQLFGPGISLLKDIRDDKIHNWSNYENHAIKKLVGYLKHKGRQGGAMKFSYSEFPPFLIIRIF
jgi:hypothetical protein